MRLAFEIRVDDLERDEHFGHRAVPPRLVDRRQQSDCSFAGAVRIETFFCDRGSQLRNCRHDFPAHCFSKIQARARLAAAVYSCVRERLNTALFGTGNPDFYRERCARGNRTTRARNREASWELRAPSSLVIELNVCLHSVVVVLSADVLAAIVQEVAEAEHEPIAETVIEFDDVAFPISATTCPVRVSERPDDCVCSQLLIHVADSPCARPRDLAQARA